jgi:transcriptional regulator with XRE-family HTH domain
MRRVPEVDEVVQRIVKKMKPWGLTLSFLAQNLGVSRQYVWQIVHYRTILSRTKVLEIEKAVDRIIENRAHVRTFGDRLRAARISAGYTLKEVGSMIGYTWVGVERWEKNQCVPKPGVLWHLCNLYCVGEEWFKECFPPGWAPSQGGVPVRTQHGDTGRACGSVPGPRQRSIGPSRIESVPPQFGQFPRPPASPRETDTLVVIQPVISSRKPGTNFFSRPAYSAGEPVTAVRKR